MIHIRPSKEYDAPAIVEFQIAMALETENIELEKHIVNEGVMAVYGSPEKGSYFVATENDKIVGSLLITPEWSDWRNRWVMWIQSVYIIPEMRGTGIFRQMYDFIVETFRNNDEVGGLRLYVDISNTKAINVYRKLGMDGDHYKLFEYMK